MQAATSQRQARIPLQVLLEAALVEVRVVEGASPELHRSEILEIDGDSYRCSRGPAQVSASVRDFERQTSGADVYEDALRRSTRARTVTM